MAGLRFASSALAALLLLAAASVQARYIIVGNTQDPHEPWTQIGVNYTVWAEQNQLYVGDVAVFKYRAYYHVVWQLPDIQDFDTCTYDRADFIGNDTAGVGPGFFVPVTSTPLYLACGVFGHCELGQKVVINGSGGPLPANLTGVSVPPPSPPAPPYVPPPPEYNLPPLVLAFPPYEASAAPSPAPGSPSPPPPNPPGCNCVCPNVPPSSNTTVAVSASNSPSLAESSPPSGTSPPPSNSGFRAVPSLVSVVLTAVSAYLLL